MTYTSDTVSPSKRPVMYRTTCLLSEDQVDMLFSMAKDRGVHPAQVLRDAISIENYVSGVRNRGGRIIIEDKFGRAYQMLPR